MAGMTKKQLLTLLPLLIEDLGEQNEALNKASEELKNSITWWQKLTGAGLKEGMKQGFDLDSQGYYNNGLLRAYCIIQELLTEGISKEDK